MYESDVYVKIKDNTHSLLHFVGTILAEDLESALYIA